MLKAFFSLLRTPQLLLPLALFGAGFFIMSMAWGSYQEHAERDLPDMGQVDSNQDPISVQEIQSEFTSSVGMSEDFYDVIAKDNLFHRNREAWKPPEPKNDSQEENQDQNRNKENGKRRIARISHSKIRLYGTTSSEQGKTALLYMDPFQADTKYRLAREGEIVRDEGERGEWLYYKVVDIDQDRVALEASDGESVEISLYGHQRQQRQSAKNKEPSIQVVVGGEQIADSQEPSEQGSGSKEAATGQTAESSQAGDQTQGETGSGSSQARTGQGSPASGSDGETSDQDQASTEGVQEEKPQGLGAALRKMLEQRIQGSGNQEGKQIENPLKSLIERNQ